jgi:hypothetical protein
MSESPRPRTSTHPKRPSTNGKPEPNGHGEVTHRVRGASGEVAVKIKVETYEKIVKALPEIQRLAIAKSGFPMRLYPGAVIDMLVREHLK